MNRNDYIYAPWEDRDDDCTKIFHEFRHKETGKVISFDFSPYDTPSERVIQAWFDQGCPTRERFVRNGVSCPIRAEDLLG